MTKRKVFSAHFVNCPFCDYLCCTDTVMTWCANCYVEFCYSRDGEYIVFDTERKTDRFALAKAFAKAGSMSFGTGDKNNVNLKDS